MSELLFAIGVTIALPSVFCAVLSAAIVQFLGYEVFMYGVGGGLSGLFIGLVPMGVAAVRLVWE